MVNDPLIFTNFLQILFNAADTVVVGKLAGQHPLELDLLSFYQPLYLHDLQ